MNMNDESTRTGCAKCGAALTENHWRDHHMTAPAPERDDVMDLNGLTDYLWNSPQKTHYQIYNAIEAYGLAQYERGLKVCIRSLLKEGK